MDERTRAANGELLERKKTGRRKDLGLDFVKVRWGMITRRFVAHSCVSCGALDSFVPQRFLPRTACGVVEQDLDYTRRNNRLSRTILLAQNRPITNERLMRRVMLRVYIFHLWNLWQDTVYRFCKLSEEEVWCNWYGFYTRFNIDILMIIWTIIKYSVHFYRFVATMIKINRQWRNESI